MTIATTIADNVEHIADMTRVLARPNGYMTDEEVCRYLRKHLNKQVKSLTTEINYMKNDRLNAGEEG
jgi:hypothetical protein